MVKSVIEHILFENYPNESGGNYLEKSLREMEELLNNPKYNLKNISTNTIGEDIYDNFLNLITASKTQFYYDAELERSIRQVIGLAIWDRGLTEVYQFFTDIDRDNYEDEKKWNGTAFVVTKPRTIKNRAGHFNACVEQMKLKVGLRVGEEQYINMGVKGHAIGFYYKRCGTTDNYAVYILNTGDGINYQNILNDGINNSGIISHIVTKDKLCRFLTFMLIFGNYTSADDFYRIIVKDLVDNYTTANSPLIISTPTYLYSIKCPMQIIGDCTTKSMVLLIEILFKQKIYQIDLVNKKYTKDGSTKSFNKDLFDLSKEYIVFMYLLKLVLLSKELETVRGLELEELKKQYIYIGKLNDQVLLIKKEREAMIDLIGTMSIGQEGKNFNIQKLNELTEASVRICELILDSFFRIIQENKILTLTSLIQRDQSPQPKVLKDSYDARRVYNKIHLSHQIGEVRRIKDNISRVEPNIVEGVNKLSEEKPGSSFCERLDMLFTNMGQYVGSLLELRNTNDDIFYVKNHINFLVPLYFEILKKVFKYYTNDSLPYIEAYERSLCDNMIKNTYGKIQLLLSDFYQEASGPASNIYNIDTNKWNILMLKEYTQIIFISTNLILNLLRAKKPGNALVPIPENGSETVKYLNYFNTYIGSFIIRTNYELNIVMEFKNYLVSNELYKYILIPINSNNNYEPITTLEKEQNILDFYEEIIDLRNQDNVIEAKGSYIKTYYQNETINMAYPNFITNYLVLEQGSRKDIEPNAGLISQNGNKVNTKVVYNAIDKYILRKRQDYTMEGIETYSYYINYSKIAYMFEIPRGLQAYQVCLRLGRDLSELNYGNSILYANLRLYTRNIDVQYYNYTVIDSEFTLDLKQLKPRGYWGSLENKNFGYSYIYYDYNFYTNYGSINKIMKNINSFIYGSDKKYLYKQITIGKNSSNNNIYPFASNLSSETVIWDRDNLNIEILESYLTKIESLFASSVVLKSDYKNYEVIILNILDILNIIEDKIIIEKWLEYLQKIYYINSHLLNKIIDLLVYYQLAKHYKSFEDLNTNGFVRLDREHIENCYILLKKIVKFTRGLVVNNYRNSYMLDTSKIPNECYKSNKTFEKIIDTLQNHITSSLLIFDYNNLSKNQGQTTDNELSDYLKELIETVEIDFVIKQKNPTEEIQTLKEGIQNYDNIDVLVNNLFDMYKLLFTKKVTDHIYKQDNDNLIIEYDMNKFSTKNISYNTNNNQVKYTMNGTKDSVYDIIFYMSKIEIKSGLIEIINEQLSLSKSREIPQLTYELQLKNKVTFLKTDSLLQTFLRTDYTFINEKSYIEETSFEQETNSPALYGDLRYVYKNEEDKIIIKIYQKGYKILIDNNEVILLSNMLFENTSVSTIYHILLSFLNTHYINRPGDLEGKKMQYSTDSFNEVIVINLGNDILKYWCPQINKYFIFNTSTNRLYYGEWEIQLNNDIPYIFSRYTFNTNIFVGKNQDNKYAFIGTYIKTYTNKIDYTGIYVMEYQYNGVFAEKDILVLGYFLKENLNAGNIEEANTIIDIIIKNTNMHNCNSDKCELDNVRRNKYSIDLYILKNYNTAYFNYFGLIIEKIFVINLNNDIMDKIEANVSARLIGYYRKMDKYNFSKDEWSIANSALNYMEEKIYKSKPSVFTHRDVRAVNTLDALIYCCVGRGAINSQYYSSSYYYNVKTNYDNSFEGEMKFNYDLINFDKIIIPRERWNNLEPLIELVTSEKQEIIAYPKQSDLDNKSYQSDYESYLGNLSSETKYILDKEKLIELGRELKIELERVIFIYNNQVKNLKKRTNLTYNITYSVLSSISEPVSYEFVNMYLNIKKIYIAIDLVNSLLAIENTEYDCTEIYKLLSIQPMYVAKDEYSEQITKTLIYFEYMAGFIVRESQYNFTLELFRELKRESRQKIHQLLMGEGKSSTISPVLTLLLLEDMSNTRDNNKHIVHVMPTSLVQQSYRDIFNNIFYFLNRELVQKIDKDSKLNNLFNKKITIISDYLIKVFKIKKAINMPYNRDYLDLTQNCYLVFDEVDEIADPLKSQLNMLDSTTQKEKIDNEDITFKFIFVFIYYLYFSKKTQEIRTELVQYSFRDSNPHLLLDSKILNPKAKDIIFRFYKRVVELIFGSKYLEAYNFMLLNQKDKVAEGLNIEYLNIIYNFGKLIPGILKQLHRRHFGLSYKDKETISPIYNADGKIKSDEEISNLFVAVPFLADEKPSENSEFTDYLYVLALTTISYFDEPIKRLRNIDIQLYLNYIIKHFYSQKDLPPEYNEGAIRYKDLTEGIEKPLILTRDLKITNFSKNDIKIIKNNFPMKFYLINIVFKKFVRVIKFVNNLSFLDILSSNFSDKRVGFTGTPSIELPKETIEDRELEKVEKQVGGDGAVVASIIGLGRPQNQIFELNSSEDIINKALREGYHAIIDCGSAFINNTSEFVAKQIIDKINEFNNGKIVNEHHQIKCVVYVDDNNLSTSIDLDGNRVPYSSLTNRLIDRFYFYDQGHITGIDMKIYTLARGLVTVSSFNRFRDIAQGIFRLRKINKGQTVNFATNSNLFRIISDNVTSLVNYLIDSEQRYNRSQHSLFVKQNIQTIYRNYFELSSPPILKLSIPPEGFGINFEYLNINIFRQPVYLNLKDREFLMVDLLNFSQKEFDYLVKSKIIRQSSVVELINRLIHENNWDDPNASEASGQVEIEEQEQEKQTQEEQDQEEEQEQEQEQASFAIFTNALAITSLKKKQSLDITNYFEFASLGSINPYYINKNIIINPTQMTDIIGYCNANPRFRLNDYIYVDDKTNIELANKLAMEGIRSDICNYKEMIFRILAPNIFVCNQSEGKMEAFMEVWKNIGANKFIIDHYILLKLHEVNKIIDISERIINPKYKVRIILPGNIELYSNILPTQKVEFAKDILDNIRKVYIENRILIGILLKEKAITSIDVLRLFNRLYEIENKYKDTLDSKIYNIVFKENNFENTIVKEYVGKMRLERFLNIITIFKFISENYDEIDKKDISNDRNLVGLINQILKLMKQCDTKDLNRILSQISMDFSTKQSKIDFIKDFRMMLRNTFKNSLEVIKRKKITITRFWLLLTKIFNELPPPTQELCNPYTSFSIVEKDTEELSAEDINLFVKNIKGSVPA